MKFAILALFAYIASSTESNKEQIDVFVKQPLKCLKEHCRDQLKYVEDADSYKYCQRQCRNNQDCWNSCFPNIQGSAAYDLAECGLEYNCLEMAQEQLINMIGGSEQCIEKKCGYEMLTLRRDKLALKACYKNCKNNQLCWDQCMTNEANIAAIQVAQCAKNNGCVPQNNHQAEEDMACFKDRCPRQYEDLQKNNEEEYFLYCAEKCAAEPLCWAVCLPGRVRRETLDAAKCAQQHHCTQSP